jgi:hypothetical protein
MGASELGIRSDKRYANYANVSSARGRNQRCAEAGTFFRVPRRAIASAQNRRAGAQERSLGCLQWAGSGHCVDVDQEKPRAELDDAEEFFSSGDGAASEPSVSTRPVTLGDDFDIPDPSRRAEVAARRAGFVRWVAPLIGALGLCSAAALVRASLGVAPPRAEVAAPLSAALAQLEAAPAPPAALPAAPAALPPPPAALPPPPVALRATPSAALQAGARARSKPAASVPHAAPVARSSAAPRQGSSAALLGYLRSHTGAALSPAQR